MTLKEALSKPLAAFRLSVFIPGTPSVTRAIHSLELALADLEKAREAHSQNAKHYAEEVRKAREKCEQEANAAARAGRIRERLAELLA